MAKANLDKSGVEPQADSRVVKILRWLLVAVVLLAIAQGASLYRRSVENRFLYAPQSPRIVLKNRPAWMSDHLYGQIMKAARPAGTYSALDGRVLKNVYARLDPAQKTSAEPVNEKEREKSTVHIWIKKINGVRRVFGDAPGDTVEIDCEFRTPTALVFWEGFYWLVDGDGLLLPEYYEPKQVEQIMFGRDQGKRRVMLRIIEGVSPPPEIGRKWPGKDMAAALDMVKLLYGKPFADEIWRVDVSNFDYRLDQRQAQIVLHTQHRTSIRWGEPVQSDFHAELLPQDKLARLDQLQKQYGRVDGGHSVIDIRFDTITYEKTDEHANGG